MLFRALLLEAEFSVPEGMLTTNTILSMKGSARGVILAFLSMSFFKKHSLVFFGTRKPA